MSNQLKLLFVLLIAIQQVDGKAPADTTVIHGHALNYSHFADSILKGSNDDIKQIYNDSLMAFMDSALLNSSSWDYRFSAFKNVSVLLSDDKKLKIYTWLLPLNRGMLYRYFGYVQVKDDKKGLRVTKLSEVKYPSNADAEYAKLTDSTWYGALYYKILSPRYKKKTQYILLGWHGKDAYSTRKIMDNIVIHPSRIEFGKPVFRTGGKAKSRIILEYNSSANVSLNYNDDVDMIVHDHLSSSDPRPESKGMFQLYGPDMTYTGYKFKKGFWYQQNNVEVQNEKDTEAKKAKLYRDLRMQRKNE